MIPPSRRGFGYDENGVLSWLAIPPVVEAHDTGTPTWVVYGWRWRNDDGAEHSSGASFMAAEDTAITIGPEQDVGFDGATPARIRIGIDETNLGNPATRIYQLRFRINGGTWFDVTSISNGVRLAVTSGLTEGADTTSHGLVAPSGSFYNNAGQFENTTSSSSENIAQDDYFIFEAAVTFQSADLSDGDTIEIGIEEGDGPTDIGPGATMATVEIPNPRIFGTRWRKDDGDESSTGATFWKAEDVDVVVGSNVDADLDLDTNIRVRLGVDELNVSNPAAFTAQLIARINGGTPFDVNASSTGVRSSAGAETDGTATTDHGLTAPAGSFTAGEYDEVNGLFASVDLPQNGYTIFEACVQLRDADLTSSDVVEIGLNFNSVDHFFNSASATIKKLGDWIISSYGQRLDDGDLGLPASTGASWEGGTFEQFLTLEAGDVDVNRRIVIQVASQGDGESPAAGNTFQLMYQWSPTSAWVDVTASSFFIASAASLNFADDDTVTVALLSNPGFGGTASGGRADEVDGDTTTPIVIMAGGYTHLEYCIQFDGTDVLNINRTGDVDIRFGIRVDDGTEIGSPQMRRVQTPIVHTRNARLRDDTTALNTDGGWLGTESTVASKQLNDQDISFDTVYRLRLGMWNTEAGGANYFHQDFPDLDLLSYRINGGAWATLSGSNDVRQAASANISGTGSCSTRLLSNTDGSFQTDGQAWELGSSPALMTDVLANQSFENEFAFQVLSGGAVDGGDTIEFRWQAADGFGIVIDSDAGNTTPVYTMASGGVTVTPAAVGSIATVVAPLVILGSLAITPAAASTIASTVDPAVEQASMVVTPTAVGSIATSVDPTVLLGSLVIAPTPAETIAGVVDPTVAQGSIAVAPTAIGSIASTVDPTVLLGSITFAPTPAESLASVVDPTVATGPIVVSPTPAGTLAGVGNPTVELGGLTVAMGTAESLASTIDPTVAIDGISVFPTPADTIASVVNPTVVLGSIAVTPTAVGSIASVVDPTVATGPITVTPAAAGSIATTVDPTVVMPAGELIEPTPVGSIATTVDPTVLLGSLVISPTAVGSIASTVNPTVATGPITVTPAPADTIAAVVDPFVIQASLVLTTTPATTIAAAVDPTVATGPVTVAPTPAGTLAGVGNPTVEMGGLTVVAGVASSLASAIDPTVVIDGLSVFPAPADTLAGVAGPTVVLGSMVVTPTPADAIAAVVDPFVVQASMVVAPTAIGTIATTVDPTVATGPVTVTPAPADTLAGVVDPTVVQASMVVAPTAAGSIATTVDPTVVAGGSVLVAPTPAGSIATVAAPTVVLGSLAITPTPADSIASVVNPDIATGPITVTPTPADTLAGVGNPTVEMGGITVPAGIASSLASTVDPTVVIDGISVFPTPADTLAGVAGPTVALGSMVVTPAPVGSIASTVDPTVSTGGITVSPTPADTLAGAIDPTVVLGSVSVTPAAAGTIASVVDPAVLASSLSITPAAVGTIATTVDPTVIATGSEVVTPAPATTIASTVDPTVLAGGSLTVNNPGSYLYTAGYDDHGAANDDFGRYDYYVTGQVNWFSTGGKFNTGQLQVERNTTNLGKTVSAIAQPSGRAAFYMKLYIDPGVNAEFMVIAGPSSLIHFWLENGNSDRKAGVTHEDKIILVNHDDTLLGESTTIFGSSDSVPSAWLHCEAEWQLGQGTGTFRLTVDGTVEIDETGLTLGNAADPVDWRQIRWEGAQGFLVANDNYRLDDFVVQAPLGNNLETDHRIWNGLPTSDIVSQFTPSAGGDNYALVDDTDPDQDATYVESTAAEDRDIYGFAAPTVGGSDTIVGVNVKALARRASGTGDIKLGGQIGDDVILSAAISPDATLWQEQAAMLTEKPGGGAWTQADLNNFEPMAEATAAGVRITQVWYEVLTISFTRPDKPVLTIDPITNIDALLLGSTFVPGEAGTHDASHWQVTLDTDFNFLSPIYDTGVSPTQLVASMATGLTADIDYIARVRYQESTGHWSEWSDAVAFTTDGPPATPTVTFGSAEGDHIVWDGSAYVAGTGGAVHVQTRWQVTLSTDGSFSSPIIDYTTAAPGELEAYTAYGVTPFLLQYIARAQYQDENGVWSAWSAASSASPLVGTGQFYTAFAERPIGTDPSTDVVADWEEVIGADGTSTWVLTERNDATCRVVSRRVQQSGDNNSMDPIFWQGFPSVGEQIVYSRIIFDLTGTGGHTCIGDGSPDSLICRLSIGKLDEENFANLDEWNIVRSGTGEWVLAPDRGHLHGSGAEQAGNQALSFESNSPENPNALIIWEGAGNQPVGSWVQVAAKKADLTGYWWESPVPGLAFSMSSGGSGYATINVHQCGIFATWVFQTHYHFAGPLFTALTMYRNVATIVGSTLSLNHHWPDYEYVKAAVTEIGEQQSYLALGNQWGPEHEGRLSFDPDYTTGGKVGLVVFACEPTGTWGHESNSVTLFDNVIICSANVVTVEQLPEDWELRMVTPSQPLSSTWPRVTGLAGEPDVEIDFVGNAWPAITLELRNAEGELVSSWDPPGGIWGGDTYLINAGGIGVGKLGGPAARLSQQEPLSFFLLESGDNLLLESSGALALA